MLVYSRLHRKMCIIAYRTSNISSKLFNIIIEESGSFFSKSLNIAKWMVFFKIGCCLSGLGIVRKKQAHTEIVSLK